MLVRFRYRNNTLSQVAGLLVSFTSAFPLLGERCIPRTIRELFKMSFKILLELEGAHPCLHSRPMLELKEKGRLAPVISLVYGKIEYSCHAW